MLCISGIAMKSRIRFKVERKRKHIYSQLSLNHISSYIFTWGLDSILSRTILLRRSINFLLQVQMRARLNNNWSTSAVDLLCYVYPQGGNQVVQYKAWGIVWGSLILIGLYQVSEDSFLGPGRERELKIVVLDQHLSEGFPTLDKFMDAKTRF